MKKSVVLFSGGPDSLAALERARRESDVQALVFFPQGVKKKTQSIPSSRRAAMSLSTFYHLPIVVMPGGLGLPTDYYKGLLSLSPYLPDRNLLYLTLTSLYIKSGSLIYSLEDENPERVEEIYTGFCQGHPDIYDITPSFVGQLTALLSLDKTHPITIKAPYVGSTKEHLLRDLVFRYNSPVHLTWSCFHETSLIPCGTCLACQRRIAAFKKIKVRDPLRYTQEIDWTGCIDLEEKEAVEGVPIALT